MSPLTPLRRVRDDAVGTEVCIVNHNTASGTRRSAVVSELVKSCDQRTRTSAMTAAPLGAVTQWVFTDSGKPLLVSFHQKRLSVSGTGA